MGLGTRLERSLLSTVLLPGVLQSSCGEWVILPTAILIEQSPHIGSLCRLHGCFCLSYMPLVWTSQITVQPRSMTHRISTIHATRVVAAHLQQDNCLRSSFTISESLYDPQPECKLTMRRQRASSLTLLPNTDSSIFPSIDQIPILHHHPEHLQVQPCLRPVIDEAYSPQIPASPLNHPSLISFVTPLSQPQPCSIPSPPIPSPLYLPPPSLIPSTYEARVSASPMPLPSL